MAGIRTVSASQYELKNTDSATAGHVKMWVFLIFPAFEGK